MGKIRIEKPFTGLLAGRQDVDRFRFTGWAEREKDLGRPGWLIYPRGGDAPHRRPASASGSSGHLLLKVPEKTSADLAKNIFWGTITGL
jgi:hypothetical protein